jgi:hypothetical protein
MSAAPEIPTNAAPRKKPTLSFISLANNRRWLLARMALLIFERIT